jgi:hypothetical protein
VGKGTSACLGVAGAAVLEYWRMEMG